MKTITTLLQSLALSLLLVGGANAASTAAPAAMTAVVGSGGAHPARHATHPGKHASKKHPQKVDINSADAKTIHNSLLDIGASKAALIVAWRKQHGAFRSADELAQVKGIGLKTIAKNRAYIVIGSAAQPGKR